VAVPEPRLDRGRLSAGGWTLGWRAQAGSSASRRPLHHLQCRSDRAVGPGTALTSNAALRASRNGRPAAGSPNQAAGRIGGGHKGHTAGGKPGWLRGCG